VRGIQNALRREACGHGAGVGIEGYGIQVICDHLCCAEKHGGPVTSVDELDTAIRGAGQIVGDYSDQHVSTLRLRLRLSALQHASPFGLRLSAFQHVRFRGRRRFSVESLLLWDSLERLNTLHIADWLIAPDILRPQAVSRP
jgi:hypothetical protein